MKAEAELLLRKQEIAYESLTLMSHSGKNEIWRLNGTAFMLRIAPKNLTGDAVLVPLQAAVHLQQAGLHFVTPAFPTALSDVNPAGERVNGSLWFYEEATGEPTNYEQLGNVVRSLQTLGTEAIRVSGLQLPLAMSLSELHYELALLKEWGAVTADEYKLLESWLPKIERGATKLPDTERVLVHDDLWAKNTIMTEGRGLILCDADNLSWGRPDYDLAFITRGRETGMISKAQVAAFEQGYGGRIPDINTAWKLALFHRFRWVCHLIERRDTDKLAAKKLAAELPLWRRRKGPQPS